jgi:hypothetical protein
VLAEITVGGDSPLAVFAVGSGAATVALVGSVVVDGVGLVPLAAVGGVMLVPAPEATPVAVGGAIVAEFGALATAASGVEDAGAGPRETPVPVPPPGPGIGPLVDGGDVGVVTTGALAPSGAVEPGVGTDVSAGGAAVCELAEGSPGPETVPAGELEIVVLEELSDRNRKPRESVFPGSPDRAGDSASCSVAETGASAALLAATGVDVAPGTVGSCISTPMESSNVGNSGGFLVFAGAGLVVYAFVTIGDRTDREAWA